MHGTVLTGDRWSESAIFVLVSNCEPYHPHATLEIAYGRFSAISNLLLGALPPAEFDLLRSALQRVHMPLGSVLVRAWRNTNKGLLPTQRSHRFIHCARRWTCCRSSHHRTGRRSRSYAGAGERPSFTSSIVRLAGEMSIIGYRSLDAAMDRSAPLRAFLARYEALQQAVADQSVACNTIHLAQARLARRLLRLRNELADRDLR